MSPWWSLCFDDSTFFPLLIQWLWFVQTDSSFPGGWGWKTLKSGRLAYLIRVITTNFTFMNTSISSKLSVKWSEAETVRVSLAHHWLSEKINKKSGLTFCPLAPTDPWLVSLGPHSAVARQQAQRVNPHVLQPTAASKLSHGMPDSGPAVPHPYCKLNWIVLCEWVSAPYQYIGKD